MTSIITPELINYAKTIVAERGITQSEMTHEIMGDVLREAMHRMDEAVTRFAENKDAKSAFAEAIYFNVKISKQEPNQ